jgi:hypothetical protein
MIIKGKGVRNTGQMSGVVQYGDIESALSVKAGKKSI